MPEINEVCKDCLKWDKFQDKCWVWWQHKKECSQKVTTAEEWVQEQR